MSTRILKVAPPDQEAEVRFELDFQATLTREERIRLAVERSRLLLEMLARDGHSIVPGITRRL